MSRRGRLWSAVTQTGTSLSGLPASIASLIKGRIYGSVFPPRQPPVSLALDGRTVALQTLAGYIASLTFYRVGDRGGPNIPFQIPAENFFIEMPDDVQSMPFPSIAVVNDVGNYDVIGLVSYVEESTQDVYGRGTVVQWQSEYVENIQLEVWVNMKAERRAVLAGLETVFSPTEQQSGIRFHMPAYFDQLVCFTLNNRKVIDEPDSLRKRRRATLGIEMRFNIVRLINVATMQPIVTTQLDVDADGAPVTLAGPNVGRVAP
jgi:hypothetical protein